MIIIISLIRIKKCVFFSMAINAEIFLSQSEMFASLSPEHKKQVASICLPKKVKKRELLFSEGERAHGLYFCAQGSVQLFKTSEEGQEVVIKVVKPGELFAEVILFERDTYPVSAVALENCLLYILPRIQFECLLEDSDFRHDFVANLMAKMRYLTRQLQSLTTDDVESRLIRFLKTQYGDAERIHVPISKKDVAAAIGSTPETLSRLLQKLKNEGRVVWEGKTVRFSVQKKGGNQ